MTSLILATVFAAAFGLLIRVAQGMGANMVAVGAANYLTAMSVNAVLFLVGGADAPRLTTVAIAIVGGATYASAFFMVARLTLQRGASITGAVMRISTLDTGGGLPARLGRAPVGVAGRGRGRRARVAAAAHLEARRVEEGRPLPAARRSRSASSS